MTGPFSRVYEGPAPEGPPRPTTLGRDLLSTLTLAVALGWAAQVIELRPLELLRDLGNIGVFPKAT
jgi:hypothetical protein